MIRIEDVTLPTVPTDTDYQTVVWLLLEHAKELSARLEEVEYRADEPVLVVEKESATIEEIYPGALPFVATGEWTKRGSVWLDPDGYVRNQAEYKLAHPVDETDTAVEENTAQENSVQADAEGSSESAIAEDEENAG